MASQEECRVGTNHSAAYRSRSECIFTDDDTDTRVEQAAAWRHTDPGAAHEEVITEDCDGDDAREDRDASPEDVSQREGGMMAVQKRRR